MIDTLLNIIGWLTAIILVLALYTSPFLMALFFNYLREERIKERIPNHEKDESYVLYLPDKTIRIVNKEKK